MKLFDKIFGREKNNKIEDKNMSSFWEGDYCQIEIVSRKNISNIETSIKQIQKPTEAKRTEYCFTDIFMKENLPFPTLNEELRIDCFDKLMTDNGFEKAKQIRYDGLTDLSKITTNKFSLPCFIFFYDVKDEFIKNIWISTSLITSTDHFNKIQETLYELGEGYELVLINWNSSQLIDLTNRKQIEGYLMNYRK